MKQVQNETLLTAIYTSNCGSICAFNLIGYSNSLKVKHLVIITSKVNFKRVEWLQGESAVTFMVKLLQAEFLECNGNAHQHSVT